MTAQQVQWFTMGHALMRHVSDLHTVGVTLYCKHCYRQGLDDRVTVRPEPEHWRYMVTCAHKGERPVPADLITETDQLLNDQGWSLKCARKCATLGHDEGLVGNNDSQSHTLRVTCACTERIYRMAPAMVSAAS